ncbi:MAG: BatA domain-containing protein [Deltaproteobacteria bacterium]|nr:BatA domain-containing protein [Deltaproteobacteria bacterium]
MGLFDAFGLLYPAALYLFAIPPLLVIAYLARERPRQVVVSSVIAFRALRAMRGERFGGRPRLRWTFFLELLILCLAVLAIAAPYLLRKDNPTAVVIDNSAAMQARTSSGRSRFESIREKIAAALSSNDSESALYVTAPQPHEVGVFHRAEAIIAALDHIPVTDVPDDTAALTGLLTQLIANRRLGRIIFGSYRPIASPVPARIETITAGEPIANYAIGSFTLSRESFGAATLHGRATVANFSRSPQNLTVTVVADGKNAGRAEARIEAGEVTALDFPNLIPAKLYRAQLEPGDGFPLDNTAYATGSAVQGVSILFISPTPADGASLRSIPGISLTMVLPSGYSPTELAAADLAIFEYAVPKELPAANSLLVMPPPGDPIFNFKIRTAPHLDLTGWPPVDPVSDGVNFHLLNLRSGQYFGIHPWMRPVIDGAGGALMLAGNRQGYRFIATGFNPLPYLGRANLPMSILTLNMLGYLAGFGAQGTDLRTGQPWIIPAGVNEIVLPSGRREMVHPSEPFSSVTVQGIYTLIGADGSKMLRAVNLADLATSDLENATPLKIERASATPSEQVVVRTSLTPYLLAAIMVLLVLESLLVYSQSRPAIPVAGR